MQLVPKTFQKNAAFTIIEVTAAIILVGVSFAAFAQIMTLVSIQRQNSQMQQSAIDSLQNIFERLPPVDAALFEDLQKQYQAFLDDALQQNVAQTISEGKIAFDLKPLDLASDNPAEGFQTVALTATISWNESPQRPRREYSLVRLLTIPPQKQEPAQTPPATNAETEGETPE
ncbi:MAG: hypothetical protein LBT05_08790 [Planctomycetaceae bacterium]|jgi:Tfp pilus assembly protein PilV|nr:hypothetical protein [Planctomycetaceae bacterium]